MRLELEAVEVAVRQKMSATCNCERASKENEERGHYIRLLSEKKKKATHVLVH